MNVFLICRLPLVLKTPAIIHSFFSALKVLAVNNLDLHILKMGVFVKIFENNP